MKLQTGKDQKRERGMIMLVGDPGAGKTLTASTAPAPFFIDVEDRASHTGCPRAVPLSHDFNGYCEVRDFLKSLTGKMPDNDGFVHINMDGEDVPAKTLILDSVDHLQMIYWVAKSDTWNKLGAYGDMRDDFIKDIILPLLRIKMNIILIVHAKKVAPPEEVSKEKGRLPSMDLAIQGSIREVIPQYFDNIIYLINDTQTGKARIITDKGIHDNVFVPAKDTLRVFGGATFPVEFDKNGRPVRVMESVFKMIDNARAEAAIKERKINDAKRAWMDAAAANGLMTDKNNLVQMAEFKHTLGDLLETVNEDPDAALKAGLDLINAWVDPNAPKEEEKATRSRSKKE